MDEGSRASSAAATWCCIYELQSQRSKKHLTSKKVGKSSKNQENETRMDTKVKQQDETPRWNTKGLEKNKFRKTNGKNMVSERWKHQSTNFKKHIKHLTAHGLFGEGSRAASHREMVPPHVGGPRIFSGAGAFYCENRFPQLEGWPIFGWAVFFGTYLWRAKR